MKRNKKIFLIVILFITIFTGVIALIRILTTEQIVTEETILYEYSFQPSVNYTVYLKDNELYEARFQEEGSQYIKNILDFIDIQFDIAYQANQEAKVTVEYEILASVIGYSSTKEGRTDYWQKDFPLKQNKITYDDVKEWNETQNLNLHLKKYDDFSELANDITGVNLSTDLVISMKGSIDTYSDYGNLNAPINIQLTIPLQTVIFSITKGGTDLVKDQITETETIVLPLNIRNVVIISVGIGVLIILLVLSFIFIEEPLVEELLRKEVKQIIKNYGSRMVSLVTRTDKLFNNRYELHRIKDLLILADELQKPIYYIADDIDFVKDYSFYVEDRDDIYSYSLRIYHDDHMNDDIKYDEDMTEVTIS